MNKIDRLLAAWAISSGGDKTRRCVQWLDEKGWGEFVKKYATPVLNQGVKRIWLHGPFGKDGLRTLKFSDGQTGPSLYRFDEYLGAKYAVKDTCLDWIVNGFVEEMKKLTLQGIEVVCYLGTLDGLDEFEDKSKYVQRNFFQRVTDSLGPLLDSGCSLSIDSSCRAIEGSYVHRLLLLLSSRSVRTYIEAVPTLDHPHLHHWDMVCCDNQFENVKASPQIFPPIANLGGEVVIMSCTAKPAQYPTHKEWYQAAIPQIFGYGPQYSAAFNLTHYLNAGGVIADLVK